MFISVRCINLFSKPPLLTAPFEKNQQNLSDSDSRSFRKKCLGRWKKHLADISLLAGLKLEALQNYQIALDYLTAVNDPVWTGGTDVINNQNLTKLLVFK